MGDLDQFAKQTFLEETPVVTHGAITGEVPPELGMSEVRLDLVLRVKEEASEELRRLPAPWSVAREHEEIVVEVKMQGDHLDAVTFQRALLRRQARQVRLTEAAAPAVRAEVPLWIVAPHVPGFLRQFRKVVEIAPGCYEVGPSPFAFVWVAANDLPLHDALIPFLVARTGAALDAFGLWVKTRRSPGWLMHMLESLPMSTTVEEDLLRYLGPRPTDPEVLKRRLRIASYFVSQVPEVRDPIIEQGLRPLVHQFERRLARSLTDAEHAVLRERLDRLGADRLGDVVMDLPADALGAWLADPAAT